MNKIILGIIGVVVIVGAIIALTNTSSDLTDENLFGSFEDLKALGKNMTCTFTRSDEYGDVEGTVYIQSSTEKVRGDFTVTTTDGIFESHVINDGEIGYTWGDSPVGTIAMKFATDQSDQTKESPEQNQPFNPDEKVDYTCSSWNVDTDVFTPPADLEFQDFTQSMGQMQMQEESVQQIMGQQCSQCDQIPNEDAKAQCKAALGC